mmetsp:Transcript_716/g.524  ORF Transcript_716/g.524 Transcript_716/m.524 type:complete len:80 (+) Transcript_716:99-338(+)
MPFICIGPVCIPWTCLPAIAFFFWRFIKPCLPASWAAAVEAFCGKYSKKCQPYIDKVYAFFGMDKKKKKKKKKHRHAVT